MKWRTSLQDVRVFRGADIASDHLLSIASIKIKLRKTRNGQTRGKQIDSLRLRDKVIKDKYNIELQNRFKAIEEGQIISLEEYNKIFTESGEKILGFKRRKKEEWIKEETWAKIDERKQTKQKFNSSKSERIKQQFKEKFCQLDKMAKHELICKEACNRGRRYIEQGRSTNTVQNHS